MEQITTVIFLFILIASARCCFSSNAINYGDTDSLEPHIRILGDFVFRKVRSSDDLPLNTCQQPNEKFLQKAPFETNKDLFDSRRLAGVWGFRLATHNDKSIFAGAEATVKALTEGLTWNLLVEKDLALRRYTLRNVTDGSITSYFLDEEELMQKLAMEKYWNHLEILECQNFLYYLSALFGETLVTVSLVNKRSSNEELSFVVSSQGGIGGFMKLGTDDDDQL